MHVSPSHQILFGTFLFTSASEVNADDTGDHQHSPEHTVICDGEFILGRHVTGFYFRLKCVSVSLKKRKPFTKLKVD